jgi:quercetin dioxygenase-like cupin family protein
MHDMKEQTWRKRLPATRLVPLLVVSWLPLHALAAHSHSLTGPGEGRALQVLGSTITVKLAGEQTDGKYAVIEEASPVGGGPPLHIHHHEDELFYVQEGEVEFQLGEQHFRAPAGSVTFLPRNMAHTFRNVGTTPSKVLVVISPARFVGFFEEIHALGQPTPDQFKELEQKYQVIHFPSPSTGE